METTKMQNGAVTLLDILGWKGIWQRKDDAIESLLNLIKLSNKKINFFSDETRSRAAKVFKDINVEIKSISDTIALITYGECNLCLEYHSVLTSMIICRSIFEGIPVRGATSYGLLSSKDNIMVGPAIDEVAIWFELANWIGITLTPSALYRLKLNDFKYDKKRLVEYCVPLKNFGLLKTYCVNWVDIWERNKKSLDDLYAIFMESAPISPEIYQKHVNTTEFYKYIKSQVVKSEIEAATTSDI